MPVLKRPDAKIHYEVHGKGFPLLLYAPGGLRSSIEFWGPGADGAPRAMRPPTTRTSPSLSIPFAASRMRPLEKSTAASADDTFMALRVSLTAARPVEERRPPGASCLCPESARFPARLATAPRASQGRPQEE